MTGIAVVASPHDAKFAEEVRAALQAAGLDASVSQFLPKASGPHVVLIWSAALEAGHAIDAQALIGLWSENRLVTVRRDATPLPLGLRDLPSLSPSSTAEEVCAAVPGARYTTAGPPAEIEQVLVGSMADAATIGTRPTGSQEVELEFWRAIKDGNDPDDFELYVQQFPTGIYVALAKRKLAKLRGTAPEDAGAAELEKLEFEEAAKREAEVERKLAEEKANLETVLAAKETVYETSVVEGLPKSEGAALAAKVEVAKPEAGLREKLAEAPKEKKSIGVVIGAIVAIVIVGGGGWYYFNKSSFEKQAALTSALETATKATQELRQSHVRELEALKAFEQARAAEDAARKAGDPAKLKEAQEAATRAEAEAAKQAEAVKARESAAADARKKAQEAAEKSKTTAKAPEQKAPKPVAKAPEPVAKAPEPVAKAPEPKPEAPKKAGPMSRSERERLADDEAARKALAAAGRTPPGETAPVVVASAPPAASAPASTSPSSSAGEPETLYQQAVAMEQEGRAVEAIRIYRRAARAGSGKAAKRLGEIYDRGVPGVARDYAESLQWYETARQLGESIAMAGRGGSGPAVAPSPARPAPEVTAKSAPPPAPVATLEPPKAAAPVPSPVPAPVPAKAAAEPAVPVAETKSEWFSLRGLLIALLVLTLIAWRRSRRRKKAARQAQRQSVAAIGSSSTQAAVLVAALSESASPDGTASDECVRIMRECTKAAQGRVVKSIGGEITCSFSSADAAADAAIQMQEAIAELKPVGKSKIGVRIGFSCGPFAVQADGEVAGEAFDVASRLSHVAVRGQIITARDTVMRMAPMLKSATRKITSIQIEGKAAEVEVYDLMWQQSEDVATMAAARPVYGPGKAAGQAAPIDSMLFVSYSHKDRSRVEPIVSVIEEMGRRVWMDRSDITGQTGWAGQIVRAIRECRAVVLMASPNSYNSDQVVRELYLAMNHRKTIVPIEIEPAEMPDELQYILAPFQHHRLSAGETRAVLGRALAAV